MRCSVGGSRDAGMMMDMNEYCRVLQATMGWQL
jgi:hypothetical protein